MEAADAGIKVIITITEGIPVADMITASNYLKDKGSRLIGLIARVLLLQVKPKWVLCQGLYLKKVK